MAIRFLDEEVQAGATTTEVGGSSGLRFLDEPETVETEPAQSLSKGVKFLSPERADPAAFEGETEPASFASGIEKSLGDLALRVISARNTATSSFARPFVEGLPKAAAVLTGLGQKAFAGEDDEPVDVRNSRAFQLGEQLGKELDVLYPQAPEFQDEMLTKVIAGAGQLGGTIAVSAIATPWAGMAQAGLSQAADEFTAALEATEDQDKAFNTFLLNLPIGATEAIPVGKLFRRLDNVTGGGVKKILANGFKGSMEEAVQETVQTTLQNAVAKNVYESTRGIFEGVGEAALIGGILGGSVNVAGTAIAQRKETAEDADEWVDLDMAEKVLQRVETQQRAVPVRAFIEEQSNDPGLARVREIDQEFERISDDEIQDPFTGDLGFDEDSIDYDNADTDEPIAVHQSGLGIFVQGNRLEVRDEEGNFVLSTEDASGLGEIAAELVAWIGGDTSGFVGSEKVQGIKRAKFASEIARGRITVDPERLELLRQAVPEVEGAPITQEQLNDPQTLKAAAETVEVLRQLRGKLPPDDNLEQEFRDMLETMGYTGLLNRLDEPVSPNDKFFPNAQKIEEEAQEIVGPIPESEAEVFTPDFDTRFNPAGLTDPDTPVGTTFASFNSVVGQRQVNLYKDPEGTFSATLEDGQVLFEAKNHKIALVAFEFATQNSARINVEKLGARIELAIFKEEIKVDPILANRLDLTDPENFNPTNIKAEVFEGYGAKEIRFIPQTPDPEDGELIGEVGTILLEEHEDAYGVRSSFLETKLRGTGLGFVGYQAAFDMAYEEGKSLGSDTSVSSLAERVYRAFANRGYSVYKNDNTSVETDDFTGIYFNKSDDGRPIFMVAGPPGEAGIPPPEDYTKIEPDKALPPPPPENGEGERNLPVVQNNLPARQERGLVRQEQGLATEPPPSGQAPPPSQPPPPGRGLPPSSSTPPPPGSGGVHISGDQGIGTMRQKIMGWLDPRLTAPKSILRKDRVRQGKLAKEVVIIQQNMEKAINALRAQHLGKGKIDTKRFFAKKEVQQIPDIVWEAMDHILRGNAVRVASVPSLRAGPREPYFDGVRMLPPIQGDPRVGVPKELVDDDLWATLTAMRRHIDRLSRTLVKEGLIDGPLEITISQNIGAYLHRSYQKNEDPKWAKKVPDQHLTRAYDYIRSQYQQAGINLSDTAVNNLIQEIIQGPDSELRIMAGEKLGRIDTSPLKRRGDIAPEIRAIMGEITNPLSNYVKTVGKVANLVHNGIHLRDVAKTYEGVYFYRDVKDAPFGFTQRLSATNNESFGALAGMYTHPEIAQAFRAAYSDADQYSALYRNFITLNSIAKYSKTVLNQITHARNVLGGAMFMLVHGHSPTGKQVQDGLRAFRVLAQNRTPEGFAKRMQRYAELGLDTEGARSGELRDVINSVELGTGDIFENNFNHVFNTKPGSVYSKVSYGVNKMADIYRAEDVALRIMMFEAENSRLQDIYKESGRTVEDIEAEAAEVVKAVYQDYSRVPARIRALSRFPLVGTFVSFQSEVIRTSFNTVDRAKMEIASDNPGLRALGWRRIGGLAAMLAGNTVAAGVMMMLLGIDFEEDKDIKQFVPPWDENSPLIYLNGEGTQRRYFNPSAYNPLSLLSDPINAVLLGKDDEALDRYINAWTGFGSRFFSEEIMTQKILELRSNKRKASGGPIYNPGDSIGNQAADWTAHFWDGIEPGAINSARRVVRSLTGEVERSGKQLDPEAELVAFFGFRTNEIDVPVSLKFRALEFEKEVRDARAIFNKVKGDVRLGDRELFKAERQADESYERAFQKMLRTTDAAYRLGVDQGTLDSVLKEAGVSNDRLKQLNAGVHNLLDLDLN